MDLQLLTNHVIVFPMTTVTANDTRLLAAIRRSFTEYLISPRSTKKIISLHGTIAEILHSKLKEAYPEKNIDVISRGYGSDKEFAVPTLTGTKNCDITVLHDGEPIAVIPVKFVCSNYSQNANNYIDSMMGETVNIRLGNIQVHHVVIIPAYVPHFNSQGTVTHVEYMNDHNVDKYRKLFEKMQADATRAVLPNSLFFSLVDTGNKETLLTHQRDKTFQARTTAGFADVVKFQSTVARHAENLTGLFSEENQTFLQQVNDFDAFLDSIVENLFTEQ